MSLVGATPVNGPTADAPQQTALTLTLTTADAATADGPNPNPNHSRRCHSRLQQTLPQQISERNKEP
ncbi:unnamed protein product [Lota lota]